MKDRGRGAGRRGKRCVGASRRGRGRRRLEKRPRGSDASRIDQQHDQQGYYAHQWQQRKQATDLATEKEERVHVQVHVSLQSWQSKLIIPDWLFLATGTPLSAGSPPMASPGIPPGGRKGSTLDAHHLIGALFGPQIFTPRLARRNLNDHVRSFALLPYFVRPALLPGHALHHKNVRGHHLGWIAFFVVDEQVARDIDLGGVARSFPKPAVARLVWLSLYHDWPPEQNGVSLSLLGNIP